MNNSQLRKYGWGFMAIIGWVLLYSNAEAKSDYVPYPGQVEVKVSRIEAPHVVRIGFETWPGFYRDFRVVLSGVEVPKDDPGAPECEQKLARKAMAFTEQFLTQASVVYVVDMEMKNSASEDAVARILTNQGDLIEALKAEGLARPTDGDVTVPWCQ